MRAARPYDLVLYGASGFTGRQAAQYLAARAPKGLVWAVAGRNRSKLDALGCGVAVLVADSTDAASIDRLVSQARVVISTAGPFARYGTPVVDACVRWGTHYADITGETFWVDELIARYHERAATDRIRIVPFCGFDSVPSDLGAFLVARHHGAASARGYFRISGGGLNGGTVASIANIVASRRGGDSARPPGRLLPHYDPAIGAWVGPFFMAPVNTWVVRRSMRLFDDWGESYPRGFTYEEYLTYDPPLAAAKAFAGSAGMSAFALLLRSRTAFGTIERLLPRPGEGPSATRMENGWFSCDVIGATHSSARVRAQIRNQGDAGNRSTVKLLCESALCLAHGECTSRGGVLTPATAFGDQLIRRLRDADVTVIG